MVRSRLIATTLGVALAATVLAGSGCSKKSAEVTSAWPEATTERVVAKPPVPTKWPYRGTEAPSATAITRRPLSVKIENSPESRPQTGLNHADVVYETISEGGITRFNCIFMSDLPEVVGPVRSARLSDMWVVPQYNGIFVFSGSSFQVRRAVKANNLPNMSQDAGVSRPYRRASDRSAPHNLYMHPDEMYVAAKAKGYEIQGTMVPLQYGAPSTVATPAPITEIVVPFSPANTSSWKYNADSGKYLRTNNGRTHIERIDGAQLSADNVVVLWSKYSAASRDKKGSQTFDVSLGGKGRCSIFRGGMRYDGTWDATRKSPPRFKDAAGRPLKLAPGRTWFQVVPLDVTVTMK